MTTTPLPTEENVVLNRIDTHLLFVRVRGRREQADALAAIIRDVFTDIYVHVVKTDITTHFEIRCSGYFGYIDAVEHLVPHLLRGVGVPAA